MTEKHKLEPNRQRKTLKTCELDELAPAPAIRSCDYGQRILYFDSFQMSNIRDVYSIIKSGTGYRLLHDTS